MIQFIKKNIKYIYLLLALSYSCLLPIVLMLNYKFKFHNNVFILFPKFISIIAILSVIIFIVDTIINKNNIFKFIKNNKSCIFLALSFIFLSIACFNSKNVDLSIFGQKYRYGGLISYLFYIFLAILGCKLTEKNRKIFFRTIIYLATIISILALINSQDTRQFLFYQYTGVFFNTNHFATYLVYAIIITMFTFYNDKNICLSIFDYICFIILNAMLIVNNTFGCYLTIIFILIINIMFIIKNKLYIKYILLILAFILLSLTIEIDGKWLVKDNFVELLTDLNIIKQYTENYSDFTEEENLHYINSHIIYTGSYRGELWYYTFDLIKKKPFIGYGLESLELEFKNYNMDSRNDMPHNLYLYLWVCGGIFTLLFYLIGNGVVLIKNRKSFYQNNSISIIYFVILGHLFQSIFNNTLFYVTSAYAILFGMIYNNFKQSKED